MIGFSRATSSRAMKAGVPRERVPLPSSTGRWALSRITQAPDGTWQTAASAQGICRDFDVFYPPWNAAKTGFVQPYALVRFLGPLTGTPDTDTDLLPASDTLGSEAATVQSLVASRCTRYRYLNWARGTVGKSSLAPTYTADTPLASVVQDVYQHFEHSTHDPSVPVIPESHNTEYLDDFSADTTANYVAKIGTIAYDATDDEIDVGMASNWGFHYNGSEPGSIEHEAQCTYFSGSGVAGPGTGGAAVRFHTTEATDDWYYWRIDFPADTASLRRMNGGTASAELASRTMTFAGTSNIWITLRMAAAGTAGSQVVLSTWYTDHSTSKPTDPGWIESTAVSDYTDTAASGTRLDSSAHAKGGVAGHWQGVDFDNRVDFFKVRAISDRGGGGGSTQPPRTMHQFRMRSAA